MSIVLEPEQIEHSARECEILEYSFFLLDESMTGKGKTYTTCKLAEIYDFAKIIVICPVTVCQLWQMMSLQYNLGNIEAISYDSLRTREGCQPQHGYLRRIDASRQSSHTRFEVTKKYRDLLDQGVLLVIDEAQATKNDRTLISEAVAAMAQPISNSNGSRVILLSATPFDKIEQVVHMFEILGLTNKTGLSIQPIIDLAALYDSDTTESLLQEAELHRTSKGIDMVTLGYNLYIHVLRRYVSVAMTSPIRSIRTNFYVKLPRGIDMEYENAVAELHGAVSSRRSRISYTPLLSKIQTLKMHAVIRHAGKRLKDSRRCKVIIFASYNEAINLATRGLAEWKPIVITGTVKSMQARHNMISSFQRPSNECRVMIMNSAIGSVGLSLDDTDGQWPRYVYIMPDYNIMRIHQTAGRVDRIKTKSTAFIYVIYAKSEIKEFSILKALSKKTGVLMETQPDHAESGIVYPGDYPEIIEI